MNNIISTLIGVLISIMTMFNGVLSNSAGNYTASVIIHSIGLLSVTLILILSKSRIGFGKNIPLFLYSAGTIGVFTVFFTNLSFSALGVSLPLALGLLGQSLASIIVDHFGLLGMKVTKFEKKKCIGLILIVLGIVVMVVY